MGTSASGGGAGSKNPLIPSWIGDGGVYPPPEPLIPANPDENTDNPIQSDDNGEETDQENNNSSDNQQNTSLPNNQNNSAGEPNRYHQPRIQFNKFVKSGGQNQNALRKALRGYSRNAAGGTRQMARRMLPSVFRVAGFYEVINTIREQGKQTALTQFNLTSYQDKPLSEVLSALCDTIFKDNGKIYEDTQDDSITKHAYSNTVVRICELEDIDLDNLTNEQVEVMTAIFIEETIAQRVINDIGNKLTEINSKISDLVQIENNVYQIISGMVRTQIMPEIKVTQRGDRTHIETSIENIYRIAFDALAGLID